MSKTTDFGTTLKTLIQEKHITQVELAKVLKVGKTSLSMYVTGQQLPRYEVIKAISEYFNVSIDYLLGNEENCNAIQNCEVIQVPVFRDIKFTDKIDKSNPNIIRWLPVAKERFSNCNTLFYKEVQDNDMNPLLIVGDLVLFEVVRPGIDKINTGDICLCTKGDENAVIREMVNTCCGYVFNLMNVSMPPRPKTLDSIKTEDINILARALEFVHIFPDRGSNNE